MEVEVVVNFINFLLDVEQEDIEEVLEEMQNAGLNLSSIDLMIKNSLSAPYCEDQSLEKNPEAGSIPFLT